jgi:hypothetical protein
MASLNPVKLSNRELDMAILKESGGCAREDAINRIYDISTDVILHANALAKRLLGIFGVDIGFDPRKAANFKLKAPDWEAKRREIRHDDPFRKDKLGHIDREEREYEETQSKFDRGAWDQVIDLEDRIMRRALALQTAGLVICNVDYLAPDAVQEKEIMLGNESGKVPLVGTIQLTELGKQFLASGWKLRKKRNFRGDPEDEQVEIVK